MADEQQAQFEQMLIALTGNDNVMRKQAEEAYNQALNDPVWVIQALVQVGCNSANDAAANVAFVMLRKLLVRKNDAFDKLDEAAQNHVKQSLINFFGSTETKLLRRACASCISNLAVKLSSDGKNAWSELWELLMSAMQSNDTSPELRASCCLIFGQVAPFLAGAYLRPHLGTILGALSSCLMVGHGPLATEAAEALVELVKMADRQDIPAIANSNVIPTLVEAGGNYILADDTDAAEAVFGGIAAISEARPDVVKPHIANVFGAMMSTAQNAQLDKDVRHTAIDTILTYGEADPKTFRKDKDFAANFFTLMVQYASRPEMESDWATTYDSTDEANGTDFEAGASAMDRVCVILKGKQVQEMATQHIMSMINADAWESRAAALTILTYVAEGCHKQFIKHLDMIVDTLVLPRMKDDHPMVRYCAMQAIAQMSTDFKPIFQETYAAKILPALCDSLSDGVPRLVAMAAATIDQFFEELDEDDEEEFTEEEWENRVSDYKSMQPYMNPVASALIPALGNAQHDFQKQAILTCFATLTQVAGKLFTPFVDQLVPLYQQVLGLSENADSNEQLQRIRKMKCGAIECTTLLASQVGAQAFNAYAHDVCNYLMSVLAEGLDSDDVRLRYILRGWTCMVECLKQDVLPYLDNVIPRLIEVANLDCDAVVTDAEVGDDEETKQDSRVQIVRIQDKDEGTKTVKLHTSLIEDKDLAITIIMCIVQELKGHMGPYVQPIMETSLKLLEFLAYPDIRDTAAETLGYLSVTIQEADPTNAAAYLQHVLPSILKALEEEPEVSVARQMIEAVGKIADNAPAGSLTGDSVTSAGRILHEIFEESLERLEMYINERAKGNHGSEDDELDDLDHAAKSEDFLLTEVGETVGKLVKTTPEFIPLFTSEFLPFVSRLLDQTKPANYHRLGLCILCDFVEHGGDSAVPHLGVIADAFVTFCQSTESEVVQAAMFGGGVAAELVARYVPQPNEQSAAFARTMCEHCVRFLLTPSSREDEGLSVAANAVSSALRIIESFPDVIDIPTTMRAVVSHLPVQDDKDEEVRINDRLVRWAMDPSNPIMSDANMRAQILYAVKRSKYMSDDARSALQNL